MGRIRIDAVWFQAFSDDHPPAHVHAFCAEMEAIIELREDGAVALARRPDSVRPNNARRSDVRKALRLASENFDRLVALWEERHD